MSNAPSSSTGFADRFRRWIRQGDTRFRLYSRLREGLHAAYWMPYRGKKWARGAPRRAWDALYWQPYRLAPSLWQNTRYGELAATGFPPAPLPPWLRAAGRAWHRLLAQAGRTYLGSYRWIRHAEAGSLAARVTELVPTQELSFEAPGLFGPLPPGWPAPWPALRVPMAAITAAEWRDATVAGRFDTVLVGEHCVVGDLWQPRTERTRDEVFDYAHVASDHISYWRNRGAIRTMDRGIVVVGGPTVNWAHWTTEYLPKVALVDQLEAYRDWPLVVDEGLHANIVESLALVAGPRELVQLPEGTVMRLREAVTVGSPGYSAYEYRYDHYKGAPAFKREHTLFSPFALDLVRRKAWQATGAEPARDRLIYITRPKGSMRPFVGGEAIERYFASLGFELIDTGGLSAAEQVRLFSRARCIVGQSGAGLTNLVFAPAGCRVVVLAANSPHSIFHYFANMGAAMGHHVYYCYGKSIYQHGGHPGHAGFSIDSEDVRKTWQAVVSDEPALAA